MKPLLRIFALLFWIALTGLVIYEFFNVITNWKW